MMSDTDTQKKPNAPRRSSARVRWVLIVSLALNLAVVGLVAGAALRGEHRGGAVDERARAMQSRDFGFGPYVAALDPSERRVIGRAFIGKAGRPDKAHSAAQAQFEAVLDALDAEPFDAEGFRSEMLVQLKGLANLQRIGADVIVEHVASMTPEARAAYAVRLDQALKRPPRREGGRNEGGSGKPKP
jgi:uncharacterized membrane protein